MVKSTGRMVGKLLMIVVWKYGIFSDIYAAISKAIGMENDWKKRLGMVYSTNPDFQYDSGEEEESQTPEPRLQQLYVSLEDF